MFLFFDTETTGLPRNWQAPLEDLDNWPRLVQLAWLLTDENGKEVECSNRIIKPEGFIIPEGAAAVHGISTARAHEEGILLNTALKEFTNAVDEAKILVAHNMSFDEKIMGAELLRKKHEHKLFDKPKICTMHSSTDFCQIQSALRVDNGYGYKWPKLIELHQKLFDEEFEGAHDALADVKACARCFFELIKQGII
ncbi:3'-5' exonuclease [Candidatus Parcubacteria bacterium]|nr:3'-5' exonuclease [Candidatus Parcubacteria bacterium]